MIGKRKKKRGREKVRVCDTPARFISCLHLLSDRFSQKLTPNSALARLKYI